MPTGSLHGLHRFCTLSPQDEEQSLYDEANALPDKIAFMTKLLEEMVADGKLTAQEKSAMLEQLGSKVEMLNSEIAKVGLNGGMERSGGCLRRMAGWS